MVWKYFIRAVGAEVLKLKRTLALRMTLVAPMVVVVLITLVYHERKGINVTGGEWWARFSLEIVGLWSLLMLPMFVTLEAALLGGIENTEKNWKHLFALPVPRGAIYAAKLAAVVTLIGLSMLVLFVGTVGAGLLLGVLKPQYQPALSSIEWGRLARLYYLSYLCAWLMIAIQIWVSVRWQTFTVALGVGISGTVIGYVLINSEKWGKVYPYTLPVNVLAPNGNIARALLISLIGFAVVAIVGGYEFTRRDVA
jgi:lantibiotic transport system permease protein